MLFIVPLDQINKVAGIAEKELFKLKVTLNIKKTELRTFTSTSEIITADKPLQYLGFYLTDIIYIYAHLPFLVIRTE